MNREQAAARLERLSKLVREWSRQVDFDGSAPRSAIAATFREERLVAMADASHHNEEYDDRWEAEGLLELVDSAVRGAVAVARPRERLEAWMDAHPLVESSDALSHMRAEAELAAALSLASAVDGPTLDRVIAAWERLDPAGVFEHGLDGDVAATLASLAPIAADALKVRAGSMLVRDFEDAWAPEAGAAPAP